MLEWGKTPRDFTFLVKVKVKSGYKAQLKQPQLMKHKRKQRRAGANAAGAGNVRTAPSVSLGRGLAAVWSDVTEPDRQSERALAYLGSQAALLAEATQRGCGRRRQSVTASSLSPLSPSFSITCTPPLPLSHIVWNNSSWLLFPFFLHFPFGWNGSPSPSVIIYSDCRNPPQINTEASSNSFKNSKGTINQALEQFSLV